MQKLIGYLARKAARAHCKVLRGTRAAGAEQERLQKVQERTLKAFSSSWPAAYRDLFIELYRAELDTLHRGVRS